MSGPAATVGLSPFEASASLRRLRVTVANECPLLQREAIQEILVCSALIERQLEPASTLTTKPHKV